MVRAEVRVTGRVQGVGFRYSTHSEAAGFAVTGYVRNEEDGSVSIVVEGERNQIEAFLAAVHKRMSGFIRKMDVHWSEATGRWSDFSISR